MGVVIPKEASRYGREVNKNCYRDKGEVRCDLREAHAMLGGWDYPSGLGNRPPQTRPLLCLFSAFRIQRSAFSWGPQSLNAYGPTVILQISKDELTHKLDNTWIAAAG